jgi:hypothetical protein
MQGRHSLKLPRPRVHLKILAGYLAGIVDPVGTRTHTAAPIGAGDLCFQRMSKWHS